MYSYIVFLRGVNVGKGNVLLMRRFKELCEAAGLSQVRTYIQSGNAVGQSRISERTLVARLEKMLAEEMGRPIVVVVRTAKELKAVLRANPFPKIEGKKLGVMLFAKSVSKAFLSGVVAPDEEVVVKGREVYIHYRRGMGRTKLRLPKEALLGTVRNMNTIGTLCELAAEA